MNIIALRDKQDWFLSSLTYATTWDISSLTRTFGNDNMTLREAIMAMTSLKKEPLFQSVGLDYKGDGVVFSFSRDNEAEARDMVT